MFSKIKTKLLSILPDSEDISSAPTIFSNKEYLVFSLLAILLLIVPWGLVLEFSFTPWKALWVEDSYIFIEQVQGDGLYALLRTYAGYLHTILKLIAVFALLFDIENRPYVFVIGWLLIYLFMVYTIVRVAKDQGLDFWSICLLIFAITLQPTRGDIHFCLTNSQWLLGFTVILITIAANSDYLKFTKLKLAGFMLLGLSGPFTIFATILLPIRQFIYRDLKRNSWFYLTILSTAMLQSLLLITSNRVAILAVNNNLSVYKDQLNWSPFLSFFNGLLFSIDNEAGLFLVAIFWVLVCYIFIKRFKRDGRFSRESLIALGCFAVGLILFVSSIIAKHKNLTIHETYIYPNRYQWIPVGLAFFAVLLLLKNEKRLIKNVLMVIVFLIPISALSDMRSRSFFSPESYLNFSKYKDIWVNIPPFHARINSAVFLKSKKTADINSIKKVAIDLEPFGIMSASYVYENKALTLIRYGKEDIISRLLFQDKTNCGDVSDIAFEISVGNGYYGPIPVNISMLPKEGDPNAISYLTYIVPTGLIARFIDSGYLVQMLFGHDNTSSSSSSKVTEDKAYISTQLVFPYKDTKGGLIEIGLLHLDSITINSITAYCIP